VSTPLFFDQVPVLAWRAWTLAETADGPELRSVVYAHPWPARRPLRMVCEPGGCLGARWPLQPHSCGIHAFKDRASALAFPSMWEARRFTQHISPEQYVVGQVSMWGRVVEHERGYRCELAYPYAVLLSPEQGGIAPPLAARYGVDVLIDPHAPRPSVLGA
jgi:hypothetical protein